MSELAFLELIIEWRESALAKIAARIIAQRRARGYADLSLLLQARTLQECIEKYWSVRNAYKGVSNGR